MVLYNPKLKLEDQTNKLIESYNNRFFNNDHDNEGHDYCEYDQLGPIEQWGCYYDFLRADENFLTARKIKELIKQAPLEVCLTSPSGFIREYKQWLISTT